MAEGNKPEIFHTDDIQSEYLDQPGKPVGKLHYTPFSQHDSFPHFEACGFCGILLTDFVAEISRDLKSDRGPDRFLFPGASQSVR
ncbi:hypothetical protein WICPIJ_010111 [Wickerhamomyces pijperi]|uniref:Uncharacterized protein n=1 Tax=Wickerhamomyces pijperi TaxID=599730 RepID=A0A9P8TBH1_WICPI|nr:hypothetical protein WICPIJ_010111 [Wickerhamomyces pijperi]